MASRRPSPSPSTSTRLSIRPNSPPPLRKEPEQPNPPKPSENEPELELVIESEPKPIEETLAERRARRQAIRAKYVGISSAVLTNGSGASPSPVPSSAVLQPPLSPAVSNPISRTHSSTATPGVLDVSAAPSKRVSSVSYCSTDQGKLIQVGKHRLQRCRLLWIHSTFRRMTLIQMVRV